MLFVILFFNIKLLLIYKIFKYIIHIKLSLLFFKMLKYSLVYILLDNYYEIYTNLKI